MHTRLGLVVLVFAGEYVAQLKFTVLLMPSGTLKITGLDLDLSTIKCAFSSLVVVLMDLEPHIL